MGFDGKGAKTVRWFILAFGGLKRQKTRHTERSSLHTSIQFWLLLFLKLNCHFCKRHFIPGKGLLHTLNQLPSLTSFLTCPHKRSNIQRVLSKLNVQFCKKGSKVIRERWQRKRSTQKTLHTEGSSLHTLIQGFKDYTRLLFSKLNCQLCKRQLVLRDLTPYFEFLPSFLVSPFIPLLKNQGRQKCLVSSFDKIPHHPHTTLALFSWLSSYPACMSLLLERLVEVALDQLVSALAPSTQVDNVFFDAYSYFIFIWIS